DILCKKCEFCCDRRWRTKSRNRLRNKLQTLFKSKFGLILTPRIFGGRRADWFGHIFCQLALHPLPAKIGEEIQVKDGNILQCRKWSQAKGPLFAGVIVSECFGNSPWLRCCLQLVFLLPLPRNRQRGPLSLLPIFLRKPIPLTGWPAESWQKATEPVRAK